MRRISATDLMPDFTGSFLDRGRYQLLENIGCGAYGKVYHAVDMSHRSQALAVKCLSKPTRDSRHHLIQQRELENHKLVSGHPNIVTFHRSFSDGLFVYVVLDLCPGGDLFYAITEKHLFEGNECLTKSAFVQLIDAVAYCHRQGVFHRDIKPENILCSDDGSVIRLTDFGLSIMSPYSTDFRCGTSQYMSPECIGQHIETREFPTSHNDIWALGVILTNMITNRSPWKYASVEDECFVTYLQDNDFLKLTLPISEGTNDILKDVFVVNPTRRLTLAKMRSRILALDAIWTSCDDPSDANEQHPNVSTSEAGSHGQSNIISEADDIPIYVHDESDSPSVSTDAGPLTVPFCGSSVSSRPESKGPITPTTRAVDVGPPVDIPDISDAILGDSVCSQKSSVVYKPQDIVANVKAKRSTGIFRAAVRLFKMLSKSDPVP